MSARMSRTRRVVGSAAALGALSASLVAVGAGTAVAAPATVSDVTLAWGLSGEQGGGAFFGGCNFLSAGTAGNTGSSRLWTEADGFYASSSGNVRIEKPTANGDWVQPSWSTKCQGPAGTPVSPASPTSLTGNRVVFSGGTGTVGASLKTATISWKGSFTSAFYGGLTYWSAKNPTLTVSNGTGTLTAKLSGYGAAMDDPSQWTKIAPRTVTLATLSGVSLTAGGFTVTPNYVGVAVTTPAGATQQSPRTDANAAYWGSFPQAFVDFQQLTGQTSYWFSSGGSRDAAKPASALTVGWSVAERVKPSVTSQPRNVTVDAGEAATFTVGAAGTPTPSVIWQVRTGGTGAWATIADETGTTLTVDTTAAMSGNTYRAVLQNGIGGKVPTRAATLEVVDAG